MSDDNYMFQDYIHRVGRTTHVGRSGVSIPVKQYEIEWFIQIESLIGKKLPKHPAEEEVLVLLERVTEAKRIAHMKIKESGGRERRRRFRNNSRWPLTFAQCTLSWSKEEHLLGKTRRA
ncbi:hypothetical protein RND81_03G077000 [Saponaria officinalis]|uniref:Uncharacterized protein n=1 Tax=Saponaria officinalis TaxID=3572 RepID=A0AAW1M1Z6_SAPOF